MFQTTHQRFMFWRVSVRTFTRNRKLRTAERVLHKYDLQFHCNLVTNCCLPSDGIMLSG